MKKRLIADIVVLVIYLIAAFPAISGINAHEWIGLAAGIILITHCAQRGMLGRSVRKKRTGMQTLRIAINVLLGLVLASCMVSGIMISGSVLPTFGVFATGYYLWDPLHALSAKALLALLLVHVVLNIEVVSRMFKKTKLSHEGALQQRDKD